MKTSDKQLNLAGFGYADREAWETEQELLEVGDDRALARDDPVPDGLLVLNGPVAPTSEVTRSLLVTTGFYIFDLLESDDTGPEHVWRIGAVEVLESG